MPSANPFDFVSNYWADARQRSILALAPRITNVHGEIKPDEEGRWRRVENLFDGMSLDTPTQESARA